MKVFLLVFISFLMTGFSEAQNLIIKAGHLFDQRSAKMLTDQMIIVKNGKIEQVGSNLKDNPFDDIEAIKSVHFVMKEGKKSYDRIYLSSVFVL
jgi:hypothetical protein